MSEERELLKEEFMISFTLGLILPLISKDNQCDQTRAHIAQAGYLLESLLSSS